MGLFGFGKKDAAPKVQGANKIVSFLNAADDAYMLAFDSKNIKPFAPYADPAVCAAVLQEVLSGEDRFFGTSKLRQRTWSIVLADGRQVTAVKTVGHEAVRCGHGLSIPLGDTIQQQWDIRVDGVHQFKVFKIGRAKLNEQY